jgi:hypothetical protein
LFYNKSFGFQPIAAFIGLLFLFSNGTFAQENPTPVLEGTEVAPMVSKHNVKRATLLSAFLPGAGQIYNRRWWKVPIIYGGLGATIYLARTNQLEYLRYSNAFDQRQNSITDEFAGRLNESQLIANMRTFQSNRDLALVFLAVVYGLNIIDANVDAHLFEFDISDDLSFRLEPKTWYNAGQPSSGFSLTFSF